MKRTLPLVLLASTALHTGLWAQSDVANRTKPERRTLDPGMIINPTRGSAFSAPRQVFYSEDFSGGGIPAGWTNVDALTPGNGTPVLFEWANDPTVVEPAAVSYPDIIGTFNAPGATNGFIWANSDRGLAVAPATEHLTELTTNAIDCSAQSSVMLTMKSTIGVFENAANEFVKVRVSTDLTTWQDFFPFPCLETGNPVQPCSRFSDNPTDVMVDLSPAAAGQPVVYLQFQWQGGWEYYWAIDDIELSPLPDNDLRMNYGYVSTVSDGKEYGRIPAAQLPSTMLVGAEILNFGLAQHTNITMTCSITDDQGTEVLSSMQAFPSLVSQTSTVLEGTVAPSGLAVGLYEAEFTMTSDQIVLDVNPNDNARTRTFEVTNHLYSLDNLGGHPEGLEVIAQTGSGSFESNAENVKLMVMYHLNGPMTVTAVEIALGSATTAGSQVVVSVLDTADVFSSPAVVNSPVNGLESGFYTITQADVDAGKAIVEFPEAVTLSVNAYYVVASLYAVGEANVYIQDDLTVPQPGLASVLWLPFDPDGIFLYGGNGNAWGVRLSSDPSIGVHEHETLHGVAIYPNPTNGLLRVNVEENAPYVLEVMNILGEVVMSTNFMSNTVIDLSGHANGAYNVRVSSGPRSTTQRVIRH